MPLAGYDQCLELSGGSWGLTSCPNAGGRGRDDQRCRLQTVVRAAHGLWAHTCRLPPPPGTVRGLWAWAAANQQPTGLREFLATRLSAVSSFGDEKCTRKRLSRGEDLCSDLWCADRRHHAGCCRPKSRRWSPPPASTSPGTHRACRGARAGTTESL